MTKEKRLEILFEYGSYQNYIKEYFKKNNPKIRESIACAALEFTFYEEQEKIDSIIDNMALNMIHQFFEDDIDMLPHIGRYIEDIVSPLCN